MKRILSFLLCATLLFSVVSVTGSAAEEANPERDAVVADIISGITARQICWRLVPILT